MEELTADQKAMIVKAEPIATLLGGEVTNITHYSFSISLERDMQAGGRLPRRGYHFRNQGDKWTISGHWPHDKKGHMHCPGQEDRVKIGVSQSKSPAQIVADINKRLKPEYERQHAKMLEVAARYDAQEDRRRASIAKLTEAFGTDFSEGSSGGDNCWIKGCGVRVLRVMDGGNVIIETNGIDIDKAIEALKFLKNA